MASECAHWLRADLCHEALRVGRPLAALMPNKPDVHGLAAPLWNGRHRALPPAPTRQETRSSCWSGSQPPDWSQIQSGLDGLNRAMAVTPAPINFRR